MDTFVTMFGKKNRLFCSHQNIYIIFMVAALLNFPNLCHAPYRAPLTKTIYSLLSVLSFSLLQELITVFAHRAFSLVKIKTRCITLFFSFLTPWALSREEYQVGSGTRLAPPSLEPSFSLRIFLLETQHSA